ncbi:MAG: aldo/keto reductase [Clostridia bacterium]|nr:aldo/keto reductase [Clostridia bacterium]
MKNITLGSTMITVPQNGFGALPIQRISKENAVNLLRRAYEGGMRYFDTARGYTDSEEKLGLAFGDGWLKREQVYIATKTHAKTPEGFWKDLETSLRLLKTDYIDVYQFHNLSQCYRLGDGTGMYESMVEAKKQGKIRHIAATTHKIGVAREVVESGLYETLQYPMSYLAEDKEVELVKLCQQHNMGFVCMKGLAGGLITNARAAMAFVSQFDGLIPIWGIQREKELDDWLSFMDETPVLDDELSAFIAKERQELMGFFCRGCGYCLPCTVGIKISDCNRMSLMIRRAPSAGWLSEQWQTEMEKIDECVDCRQCVSKCPYELDIPNLLRKNLEDYRNVLAGKTSVTD